MIKLIGAVFIIVATTWTGFEASRHLTERPRQLRQLKSALQSLEAEIMYGHTPLHEAARRLASQLSKPLSWFFESFSKKLTNSETTVKDAWEESLQEFGETLGRHDRFSQQKQIRLALTHLEREEADAHEKQARYEKMMKSLGFLSGLLLVILLM
jgi:stage III sporulation protein AB